MIDFNKIINGGWLAGKKTYITSIVGILGAVGAYLIGDYNLVSMLETVFPLFGIMFLRQGIKK